MQQLLKLILVCIGITATAWFSVDLLAFTLAQPYVGFIVLGSLLLLIFTRKLRYRFITAPLALSCLVLFFLVKPSLEEERASHAARALLAGAPRVTHETDERGDTFSIEFALRGRTDLIHLNFDCATQNEDIAWKVRLISEHSGVESRLSESWAFKIGKDDRWHATGEFDSQEVNAGSGTRFSLDSAELNIPTEQIVWLLGAQDRIQIKVGEIIHELDRKDVMDLRRWVSGVLSASDSHAFGSEFDALRPSIKKAHRYYLW